MLKVRNKKIIIIDPSGEALASRAFDEWEIVLSIVDTENTRKKALGMLGDEILPKILTINELLNMPFENGVDEYLLKRYRRLEGDFIYNNSRFYSSLPKLKYIYYNNLKFWYDLFSKERPCAVFLNTAFHAQVFDLFALEMAEDFGAKAYFLATYSDYRVPLRGLVNYNSRNIVVIDDFRVDVDSIKKNLYGVKGGDGIDSNAGSRSFQYLIDLMKDKLARAAGKDYKIFFRILKHHVIKGIGYIFYAAARSFVRLGRMDYHTGSDVIIIPNHHSLLHTIHSFFYMKYGSLLEKIYSKNKLPKEKFLYFSLHLEPEAVLMNSVMNQQLYLIEFIACNLPAGWRLVVKEHPEQFVLNNYEHYYYLLVNFRSLKWFEIYRRVSEVPNAVLVRRSMDSEQILNQATAVFSIAGSITLEALYTNTAVACGRGSIYDNLSEKIRSIGSVTDLRKFLYDCESGVLDADSAGLESIQMNKLFLGDALGYQKMVRAIERDLECVP